MTGTTPPGKLAALADDHALAAARGHLDLRGDGVRAVLHADEGVLHDACHARVERERRAIAHEVGATGNCCLAREVLEFRVELGVAGQFILWAAGESGLLPVVGEASGAGDAWFDLVSVVSATLVDQFLRPR